MKLSFVGSASVGSGKILPLIYNLTSLFVFALENIVTYLLKLPGRSVFLYVTFITSVSPGRIGLFGHSGTVHPQDDFG